ncbi:MAG: hypothetical protein QOJ19_2322 [Acidimicrobiia bacterium]|jgi:hypothetical protein|nr:hypothetical protein [Acidimicrobiia bacterium]
MSSTPGHPQPSTELFTRHVAELLRHGGPLDGHEVASVEARRTPQFRWAVHVDCSDGAAYVVDGFVRLR